VKDLTLLRQMVRDIQEIFWLNPMYYGGSMTKKYKSTINTDIIAVVNIESRDKVENLDTYHCVIVDEGQCIIGSKKRRDWICSLSPQYLYCLTWTPNLNGVDDRVFEIMFGKVTQLFRKNFTPLYTQVITDYIGRFISKPADWEKATSFTNFETQLSSDSERNNMIISTIVNTLEWRKWVVFCKRTEQAKELKSKLEDLWVYTELLIWETPEDERERVRQSIIDHNWPCVIVGNVQIVWTWFNCPPLSVAYLTTAETFNGNIIQYMGRIIRDFPWKTDCKFYDFVDSSTGILANQARTRLRNAKKEYPNLIVKTILSYK
jgi:superfamily II DNA or RNA helicase